MLPDLRQGVSRGAFHDLGLDCGVLGQADELVVRLAWWSLADACLSGLVHAIEARDVLLESPLGAHLLAGRGRTATLILCGAASHLLTTRFAK